MYRSIYFFLCVFLVSCKPEPESLEFSAALDGPTLSLNCDALISDWQVALPPGSSSWEYTMASPLIISGVVISSDAEGAFYKSLIITEENGSRTLELLVDQSNTSLNYPRGSRIVLDLSSLTVKRKESQIQIGVYTEAFGNPSIAAISPVELAQKLLLCGSVELQPIEINDLSRVEDLWPNTLIKLNDVMFSRSVVGAAFASSPEEDGVRVIENCEGQELQVHYTGYEDFAATLIPSGLGSIVGLSAKEPSRGIHLAHWADMVLEEEPCALASTDEAAVFISEIADPDNNAGARFIELYNNEPHAVSLEGWTLLRYTNDAVEVSHVLELESLVIQAGAALVIAADAAVFKAVYGFSAALEAKSNSAANSNGDDTMVLVNPSGSIVDIFGVIGVDGTATAHEFEDGRALRKPTVAHGSIVFEPSEWVITNDTGEAGTIKQPANAPDDYTPGHHSIE